MLPVFVTVTVLLCGSVSLLVVLIPSLAPVVVKAPVKVTVSPPSIALPSFVVVPDVMVKSAAITGVANARQTKADVPSRKDLRGFKFIVLAWGIGCMASVLEDELSRVPLTIEYVSGSISKNGSQSLKNGRSKVLKRCTAQDVRAESRV